MLCRTPLPRWARRDPLEGILAAAAAGTAIAVAVSGLMLLGRRLGGGFSAPPATALGWFVAAAGIVLVAAVDAAASLGGWRWAGGFVRLGLVSAAVAVVPAAGAMTWPERLAGLAAMLVATVAVLTPRPRQRSVSPPPAIPSPSEQPPAHSSFPASAGRLAAVSDPTTAFVPPPTGLRQRLERIETAGEDCIRGRVILAVATGSRTGHAHVCFCPSFAALPTVELQSDYDGVEAELSVAEVLPWGLRLECRLAEPADEPLEIPVDFQARHIP
jgi:hypothetical protein